MPNRLDFAKILQDELDKKEQKNDNAIINTSNIKQNEIRGDRETDRGTPNSYIGELGRGSTLASIRYGDSGSKSKQQRSFENNQRGDSEESRSTAMGEGSKRVSRFDGSQIWRYNLKEAKRLKELFKYNDEFINRQKAFKLYTTYSKELDSIKDVNVQDLKLTLENKLDSKNTPNLNSLKNINKNNEPSKINSEDVLSAKAMLDILAEIFKKTKNKINEVILRDKEKLTEDIKEEISINENSKKELDSIENKLKDNIRKQTLRKHK